MKKLFTVFILFFFVGLSFGQDYATRGIWELSGTASFTSTTSVYDGESDDESTTTISFEPMLGYFLMDGFILGFAPMYSSSSYGDASSSTLAIFAAPGYVFNLQSNVYPFVHALVGYNSSTYNSGQVGAEDITYSGLSYGARGGIKVLIGKNALVNFGVQYLLINSEPEDWDGDRVGYNEFGVFAGFTVFVGR